MNRQPARRQSPHAGRTSSPDLASEGSPRRSSSGCRAIEPGDHPEREVEPAVDPRNGRVGGNGGLDALDKGAGGGSSPQELFPLPGDRLVPTTTAHATTTGPALYMALELSAADWLLTFATGPGRRAASRPEADSRGKRGGGATGRAVGA